MIGTISTNETLAKNTSASDKRMAVKNDWLISRWPSDPVTLNPLIADDIYGMEASRYLFDSLLWIDRSDGELKSRLAKSWTESKDRLTYGFEIREEVEFHDGKKLTAEDIVFTFEQILKPELNTGFLRNFLSDLHKIEVISPNKIRFHMTESHFRHLIMLGTTPIIPKHIYGKGDFNRHPNNRSPVGSGPYKFLEWNSGQQIQLQLYENYWGLKDSFWKNRFNFKKLIFKFIPDESIAALLFRKSEIDRFEPSAQQYQNFLADKDLYKLDIESQDGAGYTFIGWNLKKSIFKDKLERKALAHLMPLEAIQSKIYFDLSSPAVGPFPKESSKIDSELKPVDYNIEKAKALLKKAGWKLNSEKNILVKDKNEFEFEVLVPTGSEAAERILLIYQSELEKIGIRLRIKKLEWASFFSTVQNSQFDAYMMRWGAATDQDPYQFFHSSQIGKGGRNFGCYHNSKVDDLLSEARKTFDKKKRDAIYREFSKILAEDPPYLFLFETPQLLLLSGRFQNVLPIGRSGSDISEWYTPIGKEKYKSEN